MHRVILTSLAAWWALAAVAGEARADDPVAFCADQTRAYFAKQTGELDPKTEDLELVFISPRRALVRCPEMGGLPDAVVDARRGAKGWVVTPVGEFHCARYKVSGKKVIIRHAESCPDRYYHPESCERRVSHVTLGPTGHRLRLVSKRRKPICRICPDSTDDKCLGRARRAARKLHDRGKTRQAADLMVEALDHVHASALNREPPRVDPWAINDTLFYLSRTKRSCESVLETWGTFAAATKRSREALAKNRARCAEVKRARGR